jgi:predicted Zn finger-like uncharacterized protein
MKIVCDNCATKYSIADEKVRGKVFKIRCKKCSHIIVVRGGADGNVEASRDAGPAADAGFPGEDQQTIAAGRGGGTPAAGVPAAASSDQVWHLVIDREQVGPLSPSEVRAKFAAGEIDAETYAWREGFGDWLRLGSIEDFRDLGGAAPARDEGATRRTDSADLFAGAGGGDESSPADAPSGDLFGGAPAAAAYSSAPAPAAAAAEADVFGGGGGLFGAPSAAPAPRASRASSPGFAASAAAAPATEPVGGGGVDVRPMTGQRNENSVLFSLNNLQALATGGGGAKASSAPEQRPGFANSATEGSGLIDIRAMAASTLAASPSTGGSSMKGEDLPGMGAAPVFSPMAAPILMPAAPSGPPKWMWAILGVGVLAVLGIVVVGVLLLTRKPEPVAATGPVVAAAGAPAAVAPAAAGTQPAAAGTQPAAAGTQPQAAGTQPAAAVAQNDKGEEKKHGSKSATPKDHGTKVAKADTAPSPKAEAAPKAEAPAAPAPKKGGKHDALDDLLNDASPETKPAAKKAAAREESSGGGEDSSLPDQLDKGAIVSGMQKIKPRVGSCFDQFKVPGMANVAVTISGSGRVSSANVTGQFAGTPTGDCVAKAAKSASFPKFKGAPQSIVYPFILR